MIEMTSEMNVLRACGILNGLIDASAGEHLTEMGGRSFLFRRFKRYTQGELERFQRVRGIVLDEDYATFLCEVGACRLFYAGPEQLAGVEFHDIDDIASRYGDFFGESGPGAFLPVAVDDQRQLIVAMDGARNGRSAFAAFWIDCHPDDWRETADILNSWTSFESYLSRLISSMGSE